MATISRDEVLSACQRAKIRRLAAPPETSPEEEGGELNVVPFLDIITNVLMFVLATVAITFTATIETSPPPRPSIRPPSESTLGLTVLVVPEGFSVKARGGNVGPGCADLSIEIVCGVMRPNRLLTLAKTAASRRMRSDRVKYAAWRGDLPRWRATPEPSDSYR